MLTDSRSMGRRRTLARPVGDGDRSIRCECPMQDDQLPNNCHGPDAARTSWAASMAWASSLVDWHRAHHADYWLLFAEETRDEVTVLLATAICAEAAHADILATHPDHLRNISMSTLFVDRLDRSTAARELADPAGSTPMFLESGWQTYRFLRGLHRNSEHWRDLHECARTVVKHHLAAALVAHPRCIRLEDRRSVLPNVEDYVGGYEPSDGDIRDADGGGPRLLGDL